MIELGLPSVYAQTEAAIAAGDLQKADSLCFPALDQFPDDPQLHFYAATLLSKRGHHQLARLASERCLDLLPSAAAHSNLGAIMRRLNLTEESTRHLQMAIEYAPDDPNAYMNLAATYVNEGDPDPGIAAALKALELKPDMKKARWNLGLMQLEKGQFAEGWQNYRAGLVEAQRMLRSYTKDGVNEPVLLESLDQFAGLEERPTVIVWGEQGIGDEIMFSTMLPDLAEYADIILECHPRLQGMLWRTYGAFLKEIHPTRKDTYLEWPGEKPADFKCAIGDLGALFRNDIESFQKATTRRESSNQLLQPDPILTRTYRETLTQMFPGKRFIGVAWTGGVIHTMRWYRSCELKELWDLGKPDDVVLVSLQYEDDTAAIAQYVEATGRPMLRFPAVTQHYDYDHTLALVMALDEVVTVCQSVAHLSAAAGQKTRVLVPDKPAWRYGLRSPYWYWYGDNATLYRRGGPSWVNAIARLTADMGISPLPAHEIELLQRFSFHTGWTMLELGAKQFGRYKAWFERQGIVHTSVDLNGKGGALPLDLQKPLNLGAFDVVTNFGTSEHVEEQYPCWQNIHDAVKVGGYLVSTTPLPGDWPNHGKYYPTLEFYAKFAAHNDYEVAACGVLCEAPKRMIGFVGRKRSARVFAYPGDSTIWVNVNEKAKVGSYV